MRVHCATGFYSWEFMIQLNRAALHHHIEFVGDSASNEKILSILTYLNDHLTEDLSIDDLAPIFT